MQPGDGRLYKGVQMLFIIQGADIQSFLRRTLSQQLRMTAHSTATMHDMAAKCSRSNG
jgi:hypothetical protein